MLIHTIWILFIIFSVMVAILSIGLSAGKKELEDGLRRLREAESKFGLFKKTLLATGVGKVLLGANLLNPVSWGISGLIGITNLIGRRHIGGKLGSGWSAYHQGKEKYERWMLVRLIILSVDTLLFLYLFVHYLIFYLNK